MVVNFHRLQCQFCVVFISFCIKEPSQCTEILQVVAKKGGGGNLLCLFRLSANFLFVVVHYYISLIIKFKTFHYIHVDALLFIKYWKYILFFIFLKTIIINPSYMIIIMCVFCNKWQRERVIGKNCFKWRIYISKPVRLFDDVLRLR